MLIVRHSKFIYPEELKERIKDKISMYDEIETVQKTITSLKQHDCPIIVIQSDPNNPSKIVNETLVDFYQKLPDLAGSKEEYLKERDGGKEATTPVKSVTRNYSVGFSATNNFDVDWWIAILGDVLVLNLAGIEKIIHKMISKKKLLGITRAVGQIFMDDNHEPTRIQNCDFMPQFFIVNSNLIKNGLFSNFNITNRYTTEQVLGDEINRYCSDNKLNFKNLVYIISDYAYPQFISGLFYNEDRITMPRYVDGLVNSLRRLKIKFFN